MQFGKDGMLSPEEIQRRLNEPRTGAGEGLNQQPAQTEQAMSERRKSMMPQTPKDFDPDDPFEGAGGNLIADINIISTLWFNRPWFAGRSEGRERDVLTPEELQAAAHERGIIVSYQDRPLHKLQGEDFPCVILANDGSSRIVLARTDKEHLQCRTAGRIETIPVELLARSYSGVAFFIKPKVDAVSLEPFIAGGRQEAQSAGPEAELIAEGQTLVQLVMSQILSSHKGLLIQLCTAAFLGNLFTMAMPMFSMAVYDRVIPHLAWETLWALSIGIIIALSADLAVRYIRLKLVDAIGLSVSLQFQARLFSKIVHARMGQGPGLAGSFNNGLREVDALCQLLPSLLVSLAIDLPFFLLSCLLLYSIAGVVAIAPIVGVGLFAALHAFSQHRDEAALESSKLMGAQSNLLMETVGALETVKVTTSERLLLRRWERLTDAASYAGHMTRLKTNISMQAASTMSQGVIVLAMIIGVYTISKGEMTVGSMSAATLLIGRMLAPVSQIISYLHRVHQIAKTTQVIEKTLRAQTETAGDPTRPHKPVAGHIRFSGVGFTYPSEKAPCLTDVNLTIQPGEKVGIIGRVGSGKSTLLRLLLRLQECSSGSLLLDGNDIRQVAPRDLRQYFGFMKQDSILFDDTLRASICFGLESVTEQDFERAVTISGVKDFASRNAAGYGMRVGPRGERLSGGERQSVALARVLVANPQVLVMDEPTAALDNTLESRIVNDLRSYVADKTLIVATHRAPLLALVDRMIWIDGGKVMADGPKADVIRQLSGKAA